MECTAAIRDWAQSADIPGDESWRAVMARFDDLSVDCRMAIFVKIMKIESRKGWKARNLRSD